MKVKLKDACPELFLDLPDDAKLESVESESNRVIVVWALPDGTKAVRSGVVVTEGAN